MEAVAQALRTTLADRMTVHRADLEALVAIPSVSAPGFDPEVVRASAEAVRGLLARRGFDDARLLDVDGAHPAVFGSWQGAGPGAPTVLCYAHHDVQPPGDAGTWTTPPFAPTERDGRLYGRGTADDKAGILAHVAALDTWLRAAGGPPVNVKVIVEGEEETGSDHLEAFLDRYAGQMQADVVIATDSMNWRVGVPAVTYLLRGLVDAEVEVRSTTHALHSGMYGGPVPDPVGGLAKLLAGLTDASGQVAIPGFADDARPPTDAERRRLAALDFDEARFRSEAGMLDGVALTGDPGSPVLERLWMRPSATVIGLDAPGVDGSSNTIQPSARARVSVRLAPGQDPVRARDRLCAWLHESAPWGLRTTVTPGAAAGAWVADPDDERHRPAFAAASRALDAAFGIPPVLVGVGGTIPFVEPISDALAAPALLLGVEDPDTRAHGIDESLHLDDWRRVCLAHALLLGELAAG